MNYITIGVAIGIIIVVAALALTEHNIPDKAEQFCKSMNMSYEPMPENSFKTMFRCKDNTTGWLKTYTWSDIR